MNAVIMTQDQYDEIINRIDNLKSDIKGTSKTSGSEFIDNADFIQLMKISKRTAQAWRDEGIISFSQIGGKIYYRMADLQSLLDKNHKPAFKKKIVHTEWHVPAGLIFNSIRNSRDKELQLYLYLKIISSGKIKKDDIDFKEASRVLNIKSNKTITTYLNELIKRNWIGFNKSSKFYFIRGFDKVQAIENIKVRTSAVFTIEYFSHFKAWCGAIFYAYLYRKSIRSKHNETASKLKKANQSQSAAPLFYPIATTGFSTYFNVSISQASKLKKLAYDAGYIDVRKNYESTSIPLNEKELYKKYGDSNIATRIRVRKGQVVLQSIDTILPNIALSKRKKRKTYS